MFLAKLMGIVAIFLMLISVLLQMNVEIIDYPERPILYLTLIAYAMVSFTIGYFWKRR